MKKSKFAENKAGRQTVQLLIEDLRDYGLLMETAWYLLVNLVVGHVFLNRGFEWPQEKGQVMRFMW